MHLPTFAVFLAALTLALPMPLFGADGAYGCREQDPQDFLIRGVMKQAPEGFAKAVERAIRYRVEQYGYVPKITKRYGAHASAPSQAVQTLFMGLPVKVHARIVPVLACVEQEILTSCAADSYRPEHLSGLRTSNTYRGGEVSNHMFGLAVDIDPDRNPCCGCVAPWPDNPRCKIAGGPFARVQIPRCWIDAFSKYGFYWLGLDEMQDTMHFEFLGEPDPLAQ